MSMPSCFATLRLTTNSNLVGCTTGAHPKALNDRGGQDTFSLADLGDVVAHGAEIAGQRRAGYPHASLDLTA